MKKEVLFVMGILLVGLLLVSGDWVGVETEFETTGESGNYSEREIVMNYGWFFIGIGLVLALIVIYLISVKRKANKPKISKKRKVKKR